jgi:hypothetical protein
MVSLKELLELGIQLVVGGLIFWLIWWLINYIRLPQPFNKVAQVILAVVAVIFLINILIQAIGGTPLITLN